MNISYYVLDPTSNITILAETPVPVELQPSVASRLMLAEPEAEQTGFLSNEPGCDIALRMAGGEFWKRRGKQYSYGPRHWSSSSGVSKDKKTK